MKYLGVPVDEKRLKNSGTPVERNWRKSWIVGMGKTYLLEEEPY
jgi:hypothetical protein